MPALCNPCAIDHAIERLLATPNTTAFRPCRSEFMCAPGSQKNSSHSVACAKVKASIGRHFVADRILNRPTGSDERQRVNAPQYGERDYKTDLLRDSTDADSEHE